MMRFTSCFMPPGGAADIVDDGEADLYRVLAQKMPAAMLRPTSARSLWPSLSYTAGAPTARATSPSHTAVVHEILQRGPYASILGKGYAGLARRRADRAHSLPPSSRRAAPPIYPDLISDRHSHFRLVHGSNYRCVSIISLGQIETGPENS